MHVDVWQGGLVNKSLTMYDIQRIGIRLDDGQCFTIIERDGKLSVAAPELILVPPADPGSIHLQDSRIIRKKRDPGMGAIHERLYGGG